MSKFKSIDLFAGCGGLSLGLEQAGFETVFVNELHPDAMNTFLQNRPKSKLSNPKNHVLDIKTLTKTRESLQSFGKYISKEHGEIDLVCGGPPCQGYSGIGHRRTFDLEKREIPTNHLYKDMAKVISTVAPKMFLFENVRGLLNSRWTAEGEKGEIWRDVQKTFRNLSVKVGKQEFHYQIGFKLVFAKDYGVPQNRPRILMVGLRDDLNFPFANQDTSRGLLPEGLGEAPDLKDLLSDLLDPKWRERQETTFYLKDPLTEIQESLRTLPNGNVMMKGMKLTEQEYSNHSDAVIAKFQYMIQHDSEIPESMRTKKFSQKVLPKVWGKNGPSITATSLPDDYVHFSQPRILTVREWARLQMFPDWYTFAGKRTTGGRRRAGDPDAGDWTREVPKYTQIGNAVPVKLAKEVGLHFKKILGC
jgi:DNA (cytosine-5)-methyltransferase 1